MGITVSGGSITIDGGSLNLINKLNIVRDNLLFHLDAGNPSSYNGSGTTWYDISGNGNDATINGASFVSDGLSSYFAFSGGTSTPYDYIESIDLSSYSRCTIDIWIWEDDSGGRLTGNGFDRDLLVYASSPNSSSYTMRSTSGTKKFRTDTSGTARTFFADTNISSSISVSTWYRFCYVSNTSVSPAPTLWIDETEFTADGGSDATFGTLRFGDTRVSYALEGRIGNILVYDGALTDAEIQQNYDALSYRYT